MKRSIITLLTGTMVSAAALGVGAAWAGGKNDPAEVALFQKATQDVHAAIASAEGATGGKAVEAEFDDHDGTGSWDVMTLTAAGSAEVKVDAATGQVVKDQDTGDKDKTEAVTPELLGAPLSDLATAAETAGDGKVMSIDYEREDGKNLGIAVEIVKADGTIHDFLMNPADHKLTPVVEGQGDDEGGENDAEG
ncbi:hypothetical protein DRW48_07045 [Paracoccus suum]|uniref:PepSY domain-containing protein n=1 Tax=Paracoccus suum TaxID=2259340 RepID=A0A344PJC0_9RHOB|nr:PepSY domain-containing protein [Paracoccus suum]AXC49475.1 hypothetical protein DRW48_07045 [Paracoccus suum]